jgi:hypothetical protein
MSGSIFDHQAVMFTSHVIRPQSTAKGVPNANEVIQTRRSVPTWLAYIWSSISWRCFWKSFQSYMMALHLVCSLSTLAISSIFSLPSSRP